MTRAGWVIAHVDRFGRVEAAAYGPVPFWAGPRQTSRDGEDFAVLMLCDLAAPGVLDLYIDCEGTVSTIQAGLGSGASAHDQRPHLWGRTAGWRGDDVGVGF